LLRYYRNPILAFFLCNAGIIALVRPVPIDHAVLTFYLPLAFITTPMTSGFMLTKRVPRWAGSVLILVYILVYAVLVVGEWFMEMHQGALAKISGVCAILDEGGRDTLHQKCPRHSALVRPLPSARILRRALAIKPARAAMALLAKD